MSEIGTNFFVYGTLMPGESNYRQIEDFVIDHRPGTVDGVLVDLGAFPALLPGEGIVKGIVLDIVPAALEITDRIEGYRQDQRRCFYLREKVLAHAQDDQELTAWTYFFADPANIADRPRLAIGELNGVPLHAWLLD